MVSQLEKTKQTKTNKGFTPIFWLAGPTSRVVLVLLVSLGIREGKLTTLCKHLKNEKETNKTKTTREVGAANQNVGVTTLVFFGLFGYSSCETQKHVFFSLVYLVCVRGGLPLAPSLIYRETNKTKTTRELGPANHNIGVNTLFFLFVWFF